MTQYPYQDRCAKTGSRLHGQPPLAHREACLKQDRRLHGRLAQAYSRQTEPLFSKADLRPAAEISRRAMRRRLPRSRVSATTPRLPADSDPRCGPHYDFMRRITAVPDLSGMRMMLSGLSAKNASTASMTPGHALLP